MPRSTGVKDKVDEAAVGLFAAVATENYIRADAYASGGLLSSPG